MYKKILELNDEKVHKYLYRNYYEELKYIHGKGGIFFHEKRSIYEENRSFMENCVGGRGG